MKHLDIILKAVHKNTNPVKIILFGSRAKRTSHERSDFDIAVIQSTKPKLKQQANITLSLLNMGYDWKVSPDIHLFSKETFEERSKQDDLFVSEILKGKVLYG